MENQFYYNSFIESILTYERNKLILMDESDFVPKYFKKLYVWEKAGKKAQFIDTIGIQNHKRVSSTMFISCRSDNSAPILLITKERTNDALNFISYVFEGM